MKDLKLAVEALLSLLLQCSKEFAFPHRRKDTDMTTQSIDQFVAFGKENVDAIVKSSSLAIKGIEDLTKAYTSIANQSIEQTVSAVKALTSVKSPTEFQTVYSTIAKTNLEYLVAEGRKIQELASSVVTSSAAPINARIQAVAGNFKPV
jgi:phasin family protein